MVSANDPRSELLDRASVTRVEPTGTVEAPFCADPLADVLATVRMSAALFFVIDATSPWGIHVPEAESYAGIILPGDRHILSYHIVVEGEGWASVPGAEPVRFGAGDIIVFPHGDPYVMESAPGTPPEFDREGELAFFRALAAGRLPFVIREGGGDPPPARFICGFLGCEARPYNPLLASLPRLLHLRRPDHGRGDLLDGLIALTMEEAQRGAAGGRSVRLRLSELLFIELLRRYAAPDPKPAGWLAGLGDPGVARALTALHARPAHGWTVATLAREAGVSRSALAERFASRVGLPPLTYLRLWRMQIAAGLLAEGVIPIAEVARRVGYDSEAAFSRGFKKLTGAAPDVWRRGMIEHSAG
jgi:AraC-like DNA-binding protein